MNNLQLFDSTLVKLAKTYNIPPLEWEDIAQELRLHLFKKEKARQKPIESYKDWAYVLCRNKIRDLALHYQAQKRDYRKQVSLDELKEKGLEI